MVFEWSKLNYNVAGDNGGIYWGREHVMRQCVDEEGDNFIAIIQDPKTSEFRYCVIEWGSNDRPFEALPILAVSDFDEGQKVVEAIYRLTQKRTN